MISLWWFREVTELILAFWSEPARGVNFGLPRKDLESIGCLNSYQLNYNFRRLFWLKNEMLLRLLKGSVQALQLCMPGLGSLPHAWNARCFKRKAIVSR